MPPKGPEGNQENPNKNLDGMENIAKTEDPEAVSIKMEKKELENKINELVKENKDLVGQSDAIVNKMIQEKFSDIVYFLNYFGGLWKSGFWIKIINCPALKANGHDNISSSDISISGPAQKKEIVQAFLSLPQDIVNIQLNEFNTKNPNHTINAEIFKGLNEYKSTQVKIQTNESSFNTYKDMLNKLPTNPTLNSGPVDLAEYEESQKIWELFELPVNEQEKITKNMNDIKNTYETYTITKIHLKWYADATQVSPNGKIKIEEYFTKHLTALKEKGFNTTKLPVSYASLGQRLVDNRTWINAQADPTKNEIITDDILKNDTKIANRAFALTRSIMQISWMNEEQSQLLSKADLALDIHISKKKWDIETRGGIVFDGIGSVHGEEEKFIVDNKASEVLMQTDLNIAVQVGNIIKIFKFRKSDKVNPTWTINNVSLLAQVVDEWHVWAYGVWKNTLDDMKRTSQSIKYSAADLGWPLFYMNMSDVPGDPIIDKIKNSDLKDPDKIPSVNELLDLYNTMGGSKGETEKFQKIYSIQP